MWCRHNTLDEAYGCVYCNRWKPVKEGKSMSWASHNPEKYDEIIRQGILHYVDSRLPHNGFEVPGDWLEGCKAFVETCQVDPQLRSVYDHLERLATSDIVKVEQDYFGGRADGVR